MTSTSSETNLSDAPLAKNPVDELKRQARRDERHYTDKQLEGLLKGNGGPQRAVIERLIWNVKQAREIARKRLKEMEARKDMAELLDRKLPSDVDAEATVLGTLIINPSLMDKHGLHPGHFMDPEHEQIFKAMWRLKERKEPVDVAHLVAELKRSELYVMAETAPKLADLIWLNGGTARFQEYVDRLEECHDRRRMFFSAVEVIKLVHSDELTEEIGKRARREFSCF